ncbi:MAG: motility associated factor glycosyltransferase family protein, partial [Treponema sp.]|nr:motility associated factor glycosyltransferase family protein [Treponema sp.]
MQINFTLAKNGSKTCKIENNFLHSFYNPEAEAKRFVQNIQSSFIPLAIGVTEPGVSYIAPFLKEKFPNTIIFAIRYTNQFSEYDKLWDKTFSANDKNLSENIFYELGEETICATLFLSWKTSDAIFQNESEKTWSAIKSVILKSKDILFTREHFSKRWLINSINFCKHITNTCLFEKGTSPVVVTASGISLTKMIPFLKEHRKKFFLLALSSSIPVLAHNDITPDMCLSTDGGFYAKEHLHHLLTTYQNVPLALTPESACQKSILKNNLIIPLDYGDGFSSNILKHF